MYVHFSNIQSLRKSKILPVEFLTHNLNQTSIKFYVTVIHMNSEFNLNFIIICFFFFVTEIRESNYRKSLKKTAIITWLYWFPMYSFVTRLYYSYLFIFIDFLNLFNDLQFIYLHIYLLFLIVFNIFHLCFVLIIFEWIWRNKLVNIRKIFFKTNF